MVIVKKPLSDQIYESLRADILNLHIPTGASLINRELQEKYQVSSTPVRDAINRLYMEGLVENISKSGATVISMDPIRAREINDTLTLLCKGAVSLSARNSGHEVVTEALEDCLRLQEAHLASEKYFDYDKLFHQTFFAFCKNRDLKHLAIKYSALWDLLVKASYKRSIRSKPDPLAEHRAILAAYKAGNIQEAELLMEDHFRLGTGPVLAATGGSSPLEPLHPSGL